MIKVEVFALSGCNQCSAGLDVLKQVVQTFDPHSFSWHELDLLANIDQAVQLGILSTPAIAINGRLAFSSLPSAQQLQAELAKHTSP